MKLVDERTAVRDADGEKRVWRVKTCLFAGVFDEIQVRECVDFLARALFREEEEMERFRGTVFAEGAASLVWEEHSREKRQPAEWFRCGGCEIGPDAAIEWAIVWDMKRGTVEAHGAVGNMVDPSAGDVRGWLAREVSWKRLASLGIR